MEKMLLAFFLLFPPTKGHMCSINDKDFKEFRYPEQIEYCQRNVSTKRKDQICLRDGVKDRSDFTVDHIIPLAIGGSNNDSNLWCQHHSLAVNGVEYKAYVMLRDGQISQDGAIDMVLKAKFQRNWSRILESNQ